MLASPSLSTNAATAIRGFRTPSASTRLSLAPRLCLVTGALGGFFGPHFVGFAKDLSGKPTNALYILAGLFVLVAVLAVGVPKAPPKVLAVPNTQA